MWPLQRPYSHWWRFRLTGNFMNDYYRCGWPCCFCSRLNGYVENNQGILLISTMLAASWSILIRLFRLSIYTITVINVIDTAVWCTLICKFMHILIMSFFKDPVSDLCVCFLHFCLNFHSLILIGRKQRCCRKVSQ